MDDAIAEILPRVSAALPRITLGDWPTPVEPLRLRADLWVKREDLSSAAYGGNKVRCLEPVLGHLADRGIRAAWATGAWGSNQALATAVHGARHGFDIGALLVPQPPSRAAADNLRALLATPATVRLLPTTALFPIEYVRLKLRRATIIAPGAAVPRGALGHVNAALEVARAVERGALPPLRHVVLPVGSTCTTAGLLLGFALAARLGLGGPQPPMVHAVRVTPWPVTARWRIVSLARRAAGLLHRLGGPEVPQPDLGPHLETIGGFLGRGYGHQTAAGVEADRRFQAAGGPHLDTTYAGKAGAALLARLDQLDGPTLYWSTKSAALPAQRPLAEIRAGGGVSRRVYQWLRQSETDTSGTP